MVNIGIGAYFTCKYMNHSKENISRYDYVNQARNYQYKLETSNILTLKIEYITLLKIW